VLKVTKLKNIGLPQERLRRLYYRPRQQRAALRPAVDGRACSRAVDPGIPIRRCRHSGDNSCGVKRQGTRLRAVGCASYSRGGTETGRLEAGQLCNSTRCVCLLAQLHIACCKICTYASSQLSHCQPRCCSCCRFAGSYRSYIVLAEYPQSGHSASK